MQITRKTTIKIKKNDTTFERVSFFMELCTKTSNFGVKMIARASPAITEILLKSSSKKPFLSATIAKTKIIIRKPISIGANVITTP